MKTWRKLKNIVRGGLPPKVTGGSIWILERLFDTHRLDIRLQQLREMRAGSVGREVADLLDSKGYRLIPKFENHDIKHIILGFEMTVKDEIRMQAYLVGNGNYTLPCLMALSTGIVFPSIWLELIAEYKMGRTMKSIIPLTLDECMERDLSEMRTEYGRYPAKCLDKGRMRAENQYVIATRRAMPCSGVYRPFRA
jgi:hypothetical protein